MELYITNDPFGLISAGSYSKSVSSELVRAHRTT